MQFDYVYILICKFYAAELVHNFALGYLSPIKIITLHITHVGIVHMRSRPLTLIA